jgi:hypothetical protein
MFDLKQISPILTAKFVGMVTILVFNSACAHELFIRPANSVTQEATPEPAGPAKASPISQTKSASKIKHGRHIAQHAHKGHKNMNVARNSHKHKTIAAARVASTPVPPPPQAPAPEIAPPPAPASAAAAAAAVQTENDSDSGSHIGTFVIFGLVAVAILGLIYVAPRARRTTKPKRKLVYNG